MLIRTVPDLAGSAITPESVYLGRRRVLRAGLAAAGLGWGGVPALAAPVPAGTLLPGDTLNTLQQIASYNNYYEFSPDKKAVATLAQDLDTTGWTVRIEGEVEQPRTLDIDGLLRLCRPQQRIYRMRCVEGWSMVIPWDGIPLADVLALVRPTSRARYVRFVAKQDPAHMLGQRRDTLPWPYTEGLSIAEAVHPLTLLATGVYGKPLPKQNGAPLRLVVPWKYGFKSIKAIVAIRLEHEQPPTTWPQVSRDYGFLANVNPALSFGRGSQARETRIGELQRRETQLFNGYADQVAHLYAGLDLSKAP